MLQAWLEAIVVRVIRVGEIIVVAALCATLIRADDVGDAGNADVRRFDLWEFRVEGVTLLGAELIESAVYPYLGPQKSIEDVEAAASELERAYRSAGYPVIFIEIPEQDVVGGIVTLRAVEGRVGRVTVRGSRYFTLSGIREAIPSVTSGGSLHVPSMQRDLNALNSRSADFKVAPILSPGKNPGSVDVELRVKDEVPLHGGIDINNYHSADTSPARLGLNLSYDNLWQKQHSFSLQYQVSPEKPEEVQVWVGTYLMPLPNSSNRLAFYAIDSNSDVASVGDTTVIGNGTIYGARFVLPLLSQPEAIRSLTFGFDYKDFNEIIRLDPQTSDVTPISYGLWSAQYALMLPTKKSMTKFSLAANLGVRSLFNEEEEFAYKRYNGKPNFAYLVAATERVDYLPADWQLRSAIDLQLSNSPLINNEQYSAGGVNSVRGYYQSEQLGDNGLRASLEMATPALWSLGEGLGGLRAIGFVEGAKITIEDPLPEQEDEFTLMSAGLGLRFESELGIDVNVDWGYPLKDSGNVEKGNSHSHVGLKFAF